MPPREVPLTAKDIKAAVASLRRRSGPFGVPCPNHGGPPMLLGEVRNCTPCGAYVVIPRDAEIVKEDT